MKKLLITSALALFSMQVHAASNVGVSVSVGEPGFYGTVDIGNYPPPEVVYMRPVVVHRQPMVVEPIYLHVPYGHARHWSRYCDRYDACGRPVYFVRDAWYNDVYVPEYRRRVVYREAGPRTYGRDGGWNHERRHGHGHDRD